MNKNRQSFSRSLSTTSHDSKGLKQSFQDKGYITSVEGEEGVEVLISKDGRTVNEKLLFRLAILSTDVYRRGEQIIHFSEEDLKEMARIYNEDSEHLCALYEGHASDIVFTREAIGWFLGLEYGSYTFTNRKGEEEVFTGLVGEGFYTGKGAELKSSGAYKYLSAELARHVNRRVTDSAENEGKMIFHGAAFVNNPFYFLPDINIQLDTIAADAEGFGSEIDKQELAAICKVFNLDVEEDLQSYISFNDRKFLLEVKDQNAKMYEVEQINFSSEPQGFEEEQMNKDKTKRTVKDTLAQESKVETPAGEAETVVFDAGEDVEIESETVTAIEAAADTQVEAQASAETELETEVEANAEEEVEAQAEEEVEAQAETPVEEVQATGEQQATIQEQMAAMQKQLEAFKLEREKADRAAEQFKAENERLKIAVSEAVKAQEQQASASFSAKVDAYCNSLHVKGYPSALVETVKSVAQDVEVESRDVKYNFSNDVSGEAYELDFLSLIDKIVGSIPVELFSRNEEVLANSHDDSESVEGAQGSGAGSADMILKHLNLKPRK